LTTCCYRGLNRMNTFSRKAWESHPLYWFPSIFLSWTLPNWLSVKTIWWPNGFWWHQDDRQTSRICIQGPKAKPLCCLWGPGGVKRWLLLMGGWTLEELTLIWSSRLLFLMSFNNILKRSKRNTVMGVEYPLSEIFGSRSVLHFVLSWILAYFHIHCEMS
jgi:hypothetical protein